MNKDRFLFPIIFISIVCASVTVIAIFSQDSIEKIHQITIDRRNVDVDNLANTISSNINNVFSTLVITSQLSSVNDPPLYQQINKTLHGIPSDTDMPRRSLAVNMLKNDKILETVAFLLPNGDIYMLEPYSDQLKLKQNNFAFRDYYKNVVSTKKPYMSDAIISQATGSTTSVIALPVLSDNGTLIGIWIGAMNSQFIHDNISTHYLGMNGLVAILDTSGNVITSASGISMNKTSLKDLDIFRQAINGENGSKIETIENEKMFVSYHPIKTPTTTWALIVIRPYDISFLGYETAKNEIIITIAIVTTLTTVFGMYARRTYGTIRGLVEKLDKTNKELVQADKEKGEFASMVTHDLRTPTGIIMSYSEMLLDPKAYGELNEKQKNAAQAIFHSTEKLAMMINDIFDAYKLEMKTLKLEKEKVDIVELVSQNIFELEPLASKKGVSIIPDIRVKGSVTCAPQRISQVISNLVKNSLDFTPEKDGRITIRVEKDNDLGAVFTIEDNGTGILQEHASDIFKKFYQVGKIANREHGGSGLGLPICALLVQAHGGKIWLDTTYTKGASFKFTLPESELTRIDDKSG